MAQEEWAQWVVCQDQCKCQVVLQVLEELLELEEQEQMPQRLTHQQVAQEAMPVLVLLEQELVVLVQQEWVVWVAWVTPAWAAWANPVWAAWANPAWAAVCHHSEECR